MYDPVTHLSGQNYNVCIRQNQGKCAICYIPTILPMTAAVNEQVSIRLDCVSSHCHHKQFDFIGFIWFEVSIYMLIFKKA